MKKAAAWIVEDSVLEGRAACEALAAHFDCTVFATCSAALERLAAQEIPDVVLLDWTMPDMSGIEACRYMRTVHDAVELPILLVTGRRESKEVVEALEAGANDFVSKPFAPAVLLARAKTLVRTQQLHREGLRAQAQLASTLRAIGDAVIATDAQRNVQFMNRVAEALTGWTQSMAAGRPLSDVFRILHEKTREALENPVDEVLRSRDVSGRSSHTMLVHRDGHEIPIEDSAAPILDESQALTGAVLVFREITAKRQAEAEKQALLERAVSAQAEAEIERQKLRNVFDQAPVAIAMLEGPRHTFTFANPAYRYLVNGREVEGKPLLEALPDLRGQGFDVLLSNVVATGESFVGKEHPVKLAHHSDEEWLYVNFSYQAQRAVDGHVTGVLVSAVDVTDQVMARRRAEDAADAQRQGEERQKRILKAAGAGLWDLDVTTGKIDSDARTVELLGLPDGTSLTLESSLSMLPPDDSERVSLAIQAALAGEADGSYLVHFRTGGQGAAPHRWVESRAQVLYDEHGRPLSLAGAMVDITARKRAELEREELLANAKSRAEFERQLIGIVSHDLRNPLATISMGTHLLMANEDLDQQSRKTLARIQSAAQRGARMIGDLLDFTQARLGGGIPIAPSPGNIHTLVRQVLDDIEINAPERIVRAHTAGDGHGHWDLERISQALHNLVGNALKYSSGNSVVEVRSTSDAEGVTVAVHNVGEPIPADSLARIFEPMQRATSTLNNAARSVGLGLYIVKHLVEAHAGRISVVSTKEHGTTFTFWLPKQVASQA